MHNDAANCRQIYTRNINLILDDIQPSTTDILYDKYVERKKKVAHMHWAIIDDWARKRRQSHSIPEQNIIIISLSCRIISELMTMLIPDWVNASNVLSICMYMSHIVDTQYIDSIEWIVQSTMQRF